MTHKYFIFPVVLFLAVLLCNCKDPDLTPAYIHIEYDDVNNCVDISSFNEDHDLNYDSEDLSALQQHNFTHVNVYVNNKNLGCWQLPCDVPVLDYNVNDSSVFYLIPCFRKTGMTNTINGYPFFNIYKQKIMLKGGQTYNVSQKPMRFVYSPYANFPFMETFANSSCFTPSDTANNKTTFSPTEEDGRMVGKLVLNADNEYAFDVYSTGVTLPVYNNYQYLEMTYKTDCKMEIGLKLSTGVVKNQVHQVGGVFPTNGEWKTIYFDLSNVLLGYHKTGSATTVATIVLTGVGDEGKTSNVCIDNIKVVYERSL